MDSRCRGASSRHAPRRGWRTGAPSLGQPRVRPPREPRGYQGPHQPPEPPRGRPRGPRRAPSALRSSSRAGGTTRLGSRRARLGCQPRRWVARVCRGLGGVSVAFDLVSRLMEVRAGVRVVLERLGAGGRVARVDCLAPRQAGSPVQPVGRFRFRDPTPQHDGNLTQNGAEIARLTARRIIISRLIASVFSFRRVPSPKRNSQRGAR